MKALGRHILVEFNGCNPDILNDVAIVEQEMVAAAQTAGATVINSSFHHFSPFGISGVVVIQESHLAIHTWPEYHYAAVDLFTCGESVDPWVSFEHLKQKFEATGFSAIEMNRGSLNMLKKSEDWMAHLRTEPKQGADGTYRIERNVWFTDRDENQALSLRYQGQALFNEKSPYQQVRVFDTCAYGKMLAINDMIMCTERDEFHYHEMIVHPAVQTHGKAKKILVIGGGDGGTVREIMRYDSVEKATLVEIDEAVIRASKAHLPSIASGFNDPRLEIIVGDGIEFVEKAPSETYDIVIVDGSDPVGPAKGLFSAQFYQNCRRVLKSDGLLMTQGESPLFHEGTFVELNGCLKGIFGKSSVHTILFHASTYPSGVWSLMMASKGDRHPLRDFDPLAASNFRQKSKLRYYNEELHRSAFVLPTFVREMLKEPMNPSAAL